MILNVVSVEQQVVIDDEEEYFIKSLWSKRSTHFAQGKSKIKVEKIWTKQFENNIYCLPHFSCLHTDWQQFFTETEQTN